MPAASKLSLPEKLASVVARGGPDECWPCTCKAANRKGWHRTFRWRGKTYLAHRVAYALAKGEIPEGLDVLHECDNPPCCNPAHLFLGTQVYPELGHRRVEVAHLLGRARKCT